MAAPLRPFISIDNNQRAVYHSVDAIDQGAYDALTHQYHRNAFIEVVRRWLVEIVEGAGDRPTTGQQVVQRWNSSGGYWKGRLKRKSPKHGAALQAVAPVAIVPVIPAVDADIGVRSATPALAAAPTFPPVATPVSSTAHSQPPSPSEGPLAELSPRFICQSDSAIEERQLSPTKGQADFIAADLNAPWKFADVVFQAEPSPTAERAIPLAPPRSVHLFVHPNGNGSIERQIAVKCLEVNDMVGKKGIETVDDANAEAQREVTVNQLIESTQCSHVSRYRGHSVRTSESHLIRPGDNARVMKIPQKGVHLYHDFAGCGNLGEVINRHRKSQKPINEHFIWYTLRELTEALIALHQGPGHCSKPHEPAIGLPASDEYLTGPVYPWVPILHLDIKTENVFLETKNTDYPAYPKPVLADFGLSCQATDKVVDLQHSGSEPADCHRFTGTDGWFPPERYVGGLDRLPGNQVCLDPDYAPHRWNLSEKSDVWALGLIAHKMMYAHRTDTVEEDDSRDPKSVEDATLSKEGQWREDLRRREIAADESHFNISTADIAHLPDGYSLRLCYITAECLRHNIEYRPNLTDLLDRCQQELARLDNLHGPIAGKRKRDDESDNEFTILISDAERDKKLKRFEIGELYRPRRPRTKVDLPELYREAYTDLVNAWANMTKPTVTAQNRVINAVVSFLQGEDEGFHEMTEEREWAVKYLVSCLRKRTFPESGAYVLTAAYLEEQYDKAWIDIAFEPEIKIEILQGLLDSEDFWTHESVTRGEGHQAALDAFRNAVCWGLMMLRDTVTPVVGTTGGDPAEPKNPKMQQQSALHEGVYDWIFVTPTGAFYKN